MTDIDRLLGEFMDAWVGGDRPDPDAYLARAAPDQRDALAEGIDAFLERAPVPSYGEATLRALRDDPAVQAFAGAGSWASVLPRLRSRAGVDTPALAGRLRAALGWDADGERRAREYLDGLEAGRVPADRVSRRVLRVLADALRVPAATLEAASASLRPATGLLWRTDEPGQDAVARDLDVLGSMLSPAPQDDVDRAFTGGREA
jgi:hypothetical protein